MALEFREKHFNSRIVSGEYLDDISFDGVDDVMNVVSAIKDQMEDEKGSVQLLAKVIAEVTSKAYSYLTINHSKVSISFIYSVSKKMEVLTKMSKNINVFFFIKHFEFVNSLLFNRMLDVLIDIFNGNVDLKVINSENLSKYILMIRNNTNIIFSDNSILEKLSNCPFLLEFIQNSDFDNLTKYVQSILDNCNQNVPDCTQMLNVLRLNTRRRISSSILEPVKQIKTVDSSEKFVRLSSDVLEQTILKGYSDHEYFEASEWMKKLSAGDIEVNVDNFDHRVDSRSGCVFIWITDCIPRHSRFMGFRALSAEIPFFNIFLGIIPSSSAGSHRNSHKNSRDNCSN